MYDHMTSFALYGTSGRCICKIILTSTSGSDTLTSPLEVPLSDDIPKIFGGGCCQVELKTDLVLSWYDISSSCTAVYFRDGRGFQIGKYWCDKQV